jgi:hypothetical protein
MTRHLLALVCLTCALPHVLRADEFSTFRIPQHRVYTLSGSLTGWGENTYQDYQGDRARTAYEVGHASMWGRWLYDSDPLRADLRLSAYADGDLRSWRSKDTPDDTTAGQLKTNWQDLSQDWRLQADTRFYPFSFPVGFLLGAYARGTYGQGWSSQYSKVIEGSHLSTNRQDHEAFIFDYDVSGTAGLGVGRVRDASPVFDVYVLEKRLRDLGVLTRELKPESRQRLAQMWIAGSDEAILRDRPHKYFWQDVERILREDGALRAEGLDAYSLYRIAEPYRPGGSWLGPDVWPSPPSISGTFGRFRRDCGWFAGLVVAGEHQHHIERRFTRAREQEADSGVYSLDTSHSASSHLNDYRDEFSLGPKLEFHRPLGWPLQLDVASAVLFPLDNTSKAIDAQSSLTLTYLITDRWVIAGIAQHRRLIKEYRYALYNERDRGDSWSVNVGASVQYYVEDRLSLILSLGHSQGRSAYEYTGNDVHAAYGRSNAAMIGISYDFLGVLEAPGLIPRSTIPPVEWPF